MSDRSASTSNTHHSLIPPLANNLQEPPSRPELNETLAFSQHPHSTSVPQQFLPNHSFVYETYTPQGHSSAVRLVPPPTRPTKKMRRYDSEEMDEGRSSVSGSSVGENDHEAEQGSQTLELAAPTNYEFAVPKKKRTRTLTTPRQAAVLHALMAQTPFPTTAMREEVGEQIGLTARKVQIWFQNQRQKSKRPVNYGIGTAPRPSSTNGPLSPIGASSLTPAGSPGEYYGTPQDLSMTQAGTSGSKQADYQWANGQRRRGLDGRFLPPENTPQSLTAGFWLAGPGMPGSKDSTDSGPPSPEAGAPSSLYVYPQVGRQVSPSAHRRPNTPPRCHSQSPPRMRHLGHRKSPTSQGSGERDWRTLPPLNFGPGSSHTRSASSLPSIAHPDSPFAYHAPSPFALQHQPRWESASDLVTHSHSRPSTSSWSSPRAATSYGGVPYESRPAMSHERSATESDVPPAHPSREAMREDEGPRPGTMSRRFDPVYDSVISNQARGYSSASPDGNGDVDMH